ncbi:MAG TPA: hypothetical protein V6D15_10310 [Oculatellaceae cyanobacterium]|jgi:hypothetical protein
MAQISQLFKNKVELVAYMLGSLLLALPAIAQVNTNQTNFSENLSNSQVILPALPCPVYSPPPAINTAVPGSKPIPPQAIAISVPVINQTPPAIKPPSSLPPCPIPKPPAGTERILPFLPITAANPSLDFSPTWQNNTAQIPQANQNIDTSWQNNTTAIPQADQNIDTSWQNNPTEIPAAPPSIGTPWESTRSIPPAPQPNNRLSTPFPQQDLEVPAGVELPWTATRNLPPSTSRGDASYPAPEQLETPVAKVLPLNGIVKVNIVNTTNAAIAYQVLGDTNDRILQGRANVTLANLRTPVNIIFERKDGGLIMVTPQANSEPGMLTVTLKETSNLDLDRKAMTINPTGGVFLN